MKRKDEEYKDPLNLIGKKFYKIMFKEMSKERTISLNTYTIQDKLDMYSNGGYACYSIKEKHLNVDGNVEIFCTKYIDNGFWSTPEKAIINWLKWKEHYTNQDSPLAVIYQEAFNNKEFEKLKIKYPQIFI